MCSVYSITPFTRIFFFFLYVNLYKHVLNSIFYFTSHVCTPWIPFQAVTTSGYSFNHNLQCQENNYVGWQCFREILSTSVMGQAAGSKLFSFIRVGLQAAITSVKSIVVRDGYIQWSVILTSWPYISWMIQDIMRHNASVQQLLQYFAVSRLGGRHGPASRAWSSSANVTCCSQRQSCKGGRSAWGLP